MAHAAPACLRWRRTPGGAHELTVLTPSCNWLFVLYFTTSRGSMRERWLLLLLASTDYGRPPLVRMSGTADFTH